MILRLHPFDNGIHSTTKTKLMNAAKASPTFRRPTSMQSAQDDFTNTWIKATIRKRLEKVEVAEFASLKERYRSNQDYTGQAYVNTLMDSMTSRNKAAIKDVAWDENCPWWLTEYSIKMSLWLISRN